MMDSPRTGRMGDRAGVMPATYYIWKWADNDLSGLPWDVVAQLSAGKLPVALQPFSLKTVLERLGEVADQRRTEMSELQIDAQPHESRQASFIHLRDPASDSDWLADRLLQAAWQEDLTLYDESANRLLGLPKRHVVEMPGGVQLVDIEPRHVPELLHSLGNHQPLTAYACYDRFGNMFQVWSRRRRYAVEWQILPDHDFNRHRIWVAGKMVDNPRRARLGADGSRLELFNNEILEMADAHRLWIAFLAGAARPGSYLWRDITRDLNEPGNPPRHRHQQKEDQPPP